MAADHREEAMRWVSFVLKELWAFSPDELTKIKECTDAISFLIANEIAARKMRDEW